MNLAEKLFQKIRISDGTTLDDINIISDINVTSEEGQSLLQEAIAYEDDDASLALIERGINLNNQDESGQTAMHYCGLYKNKKIAQAIANKGYDPSISDEHGNHSLWTAAFNSRGEYDVVRIIIGSGADPYHKNDHDKSPLDFANQIKDDKLTQILIG